MRTRLRLFNVLVVALIASGAYAQELSGSEAQLTRLVRHECGSCHGMTLKGGLGPALVPGALAGKPASYLKSVILGGRPGTAMPPWSPLLTEPQAAWIAERLLAGFPDAP